MSLIEKYACPECGLSVWSLNKNSQHTRTVPVFSAHCTCIETYHVFCRNLLHVAVQACGECFPEVRWEEPISQLPLQLNQKLVGRPIWDLTGGDHVPEGLHVHQLWNDGLLGTMTFMSTHIAGVPKLLPTETTSMICWCWWMSFSHVSF